MIQARTLKPYHSLLKPYIDSYMYVCGEDDFPSKAILPRPGPSLIFEFTDSFYFDDKLFIKALSGIQTQPFSYKPPRIGTKHLVIQFSPCGLSPFLALPQTELTDQIVEPEDVFGEVLNDLYQRLGNLASFEHRVKVIEHFLLNRLSDAVAHNDSILQIATILRNNPANVNFEAIQKQSSLSLRQIERRFKATVGVDMQTYIRICRFERVRSLLIQYPSINLTEIGYEAGYYDQPHFSRDVKRLTGVSPKKIESCMST